MSLREHTRDKHELAEKTEFAQLLLSGNINKEQYSNYLAQMMSIYVSLETKAHTAGIIAGMAGLPRARYIYDDLVELCGSVPVFSMLPSTERYLDYLEQLATDPDKEKRLMAHVYVRHMGDLHGGQIIKKRVPGSGKFYDFENRKELLEKIREKLDDSMANEANVAFDFAIDIMKELHE